MSEEKRFPPSELKLERLRSAGIVPYSSDTWVLGVMIGLFGAFFLLGRSGHNRLLEFAKSSWSSPIAAPEIATDQILLSNHINLTGITIVLPLLSVYLFAILITVVALGLLQTRLLFVPSALAPNFSRILSRTAKSTFIYRLVRAIGSAAKGGLCLLVLYWLVQHFYSKLTTLEDPLSDRMRKQSNVSATSDYHEINIYKSMFTGEARARNVTNRLEDKIAQNRAYLSLVAGSLCVVLFFVAIGSYFLEYHSFYRQHSMTRAEIEAEYREMEQATNFGASHFDASQLRQVQNDPRDDS